MQPVYPWEHLKIGAGAPPILTKHGWLMVYHGVEKDKSFAEKASKFIYSAGVIILSEYQPHKMIYRSPEPILIPDLEVEKIGAVDNVIFPTGLDCRDDIGQPERVDVYYGMADDRIGVAKMTIPDTISRNE